MDDEDFWEAICVGVDSRGRAGRPERGYTARATQDVWILPGAFYGTTLRIYDPGLGAWHSLWSEPLRQFYARQLGRAQGHDIVQIGNNDSGVPLRWSFTDITQNSFRWLGEYSQDEGKSWQLQAEFRARRA